MITKSTRLALTAAFAALTANTAVMAKETSTVEINIARYDLSNPAQVAKVKASIRSAARQVCGMKHDDGLAKLQSVKNCYRKAVATANAKVDQRVALHGSDGGKAIVYRSDTPVISPKR